MPQYLTVGKYNVNIEYPSAGLNKGFEQDFGVKSYNFMVEGQKVEITKVPTYFLPWAVQAY